MRVLSAIRMRRSARRYSSEAIPKEALREVLEAGRLAPSGANRQPWHYVVVDDMVVKRRIREECESADRKWWSEAPEWFLRWARSANLSRRKPFLEEAPYLIGIFYDPIKPYSLESTWVAIGFMILQATESGLATLPYTPENTAVGELLKVPRRYALAAILPIGLARDPMHVKRKRIKGLDEVASYNGYGGPISGLFGDRCSGDD